MKKRRIIGLAVTDLEKNEYACEMTKGAIYAAKQADVDLVILPGCEINAPWYDQHWEYYNFQYQYNSLYGFLRADILDGLILQLDSIGFYMSDRQFQGFLKWLPDIPTIVCGKQIPGYCNAHLKEAGLAQVMEHLIEEQGYRDIVFISGPKDNEVAQERLGIYREALERHGIPYNEERVYYGMFYNGDMEQMRSYIRSLEPMPQVICAANDSMAEMVYDILNEMELMPGRDVAVTGFDDSTTALNLQPALTSIKTNVALLGYSMVNAVLEACDGKVLPENITVQNQMVIRYSSGHTLAHETVEYEKMLAENGLRYTEALLDQLKHYLYCHTSLDLCYMDALEPLWNMVRVFCRWLQDGTLPRYRECSLLIEGVLQDSCIEYIHYEVPSKVISFLEAVMHCLIPQEEQGKWQNVLVEWSNIVQKHYIQETIKVRKELTNRQLFVSNIVKEMLCGKDERTAYYALMNLLNQSSFPKNSIFNFQKPIICENAHMMESFVLPQEFLLKVYMNTKEWEYPEEKEQLISAEQLWEKLFGGTEEARAMMINPLFVNTVIYGYILSEIQPDLLDQAETVFREISAALHGMYLTSILRGTIKQIEADNVVLSLQSKTDALTGAYNRRGFMEETEKLFRGNQDTEMKIGFLMFLDLDNLKSINDIFGHDEGDFAICQAVKMIRSCIRSSDILARIGGDEFVVAARCRAVPEIQKLVDRIKTNAVEYNQGSDKPFNVEISIGVHPFSLDEEFHLAQMLEKADAALYEDKRKKNKSAVKQTMEKV